MKNTRAFTLIEILLVVFLAGIILTIGMFASHGESFLSDIVRTHTDEIVGMIRKAQMQSLTGQPGAPYSVRFTPSTVTILPTNEIVDLADDVQLSSIQFTGGTNIVVFSTATGKPDVTGTIKITGNRGDTRTITISSFGNIDWQIP